MGKRNANKTRQRAFLYSPERPDKGVLFESEDAIAAAIEQGWEESPGDARAAAEPKEAAKESKGNGKKSGGAKKVTTGDDGE